MPSLTTRYPSRPWLLRAAAEGWVHDMGSLKNSSFWGWFLQGLELAAAAGGGQGADDEEEEELEWLSNMDAFPSVETMSAEVEAAPSAAPPARLEPLPHASHAVGPMHALRVGGDAAVAAGPGGAQHAVQRVRRALQVRAPVPRVPPHPQPHLLPAAALQLAPPRHGDAPPRGGGGGRPRRRPRRRQGPPRRARRGARRQGRVMAQLSFGDGGDRRPAMIT
jgi:hypothetical protein